jgi:hypothetical protein
MKMVRKMLELPYPRNGFGSVAVIAVIVLQSSEPESSAARASARARALPTHPRGLGESIRDRAGSKISATNPSAVAIFCMVGIGWPAVFRSKVSAHPSGVLMSQPRAKPRALATAGACALFDALVIRSRFPRQRM